jgi:hypothetical protein
LRPDDVYIKFEPECRVNTKFFKHALNLEYATKTDGPKHELVNFSPKEISSVKLYGGPFHDLYKYNLNFLNRLTRQNYGEEEFNKMKWLEMVNRVKAVEEVFRIFDWAELKHFREKKFLKETLDAIEKNRGYRPGDYYLWSRKFELMALHFKVLNEVLDYVWQQGYGSDKVLDEFEKEWRAGKIRDEEFRENERPRILLYLLKLRNQYTIPLINDQRKFRTTPSIESIRYFTQIYANLYEQAWLTADRLDKLTQLPNKTPEIEAEIENLKQKLYKINSIIEETKLAAEYFHGMISPEEYFRSLLR